MKPVDKEFFLTHCGEIKEIFDHCKVKRSSVYFDRRHTFIYLEYEGCNQNNVLKDNLMDLCHKYEYLHTNKLNSFSIAGQQVTLLKDTMEFNTSFETRQLEQYD
jgi:hypothetical protein